MSSLAASFCIIRARRKNHQWARQPNQHFPPHGGKGSVQPESTASRAQYQSLRHWSINETKPLKWRAGWVQLLVSGLQFGHPGCCWTAGCFHTSEVSRWLPPSFPKSFPHTPPAKVSEPPVRNTLCFGAVMHRVPKGARRAHKHSDKPKTCHFDPFSHVENIHIAGLLQPSHLQGIPRQESIHRRAPEHTHALAHTAVVI